MNLNRKSQYHFIGKFCDTNDGFIKLDDLDIDNATNVFVKIDVECAELNVLKSANNLLNNQCLVIL